MSMDKSKITHTDLQITLGKDLLCMVTFQMQFEIAQPFNSVNAVRISSTHSGNNSFHRLQRRGGCS